MSEIDYYIQALYNLENRIDKIKECSEDENIKIYNDEKKYML